MISRISDDFCQCIDSEQARNDLRQRGYLKDTAPIISSTLNAESKEPVVSKSESKDAGSVTGSGSMTGSVTGSGSMTGSAYGWTGSQSLVSKSESKDAGSVTGSGSMTGSVTGSGSMTGSVTGSGSMTGSGYGWTGSQSLVSKSESKDAGSVTGSGSMTGSGYGWTGSQSLVSKSESKDTGSVTDSETASGSVTGSMGSAGDKGGPIDGGKDGQSCSGPPGPVIGETPAEREVRLRAVSPARNIYRAIKSKVMLLYERTIPYQERYAAYQVRTNEEATGFHKKFRKFYEVKIKEMANEGPDDKRRRQRRLLLVSFIIYLYFLYKMYGQKVKDYITDEFVEVVKIILEKESLKETISGLAVGIIHALLQDEEVAATAATFLRDAAAVPETQNALVGLTIHVLQHPDTIREFSLLIKNLIDVLVADKVCCVSSEVMNKWSMNSLLNRGNPMSWLPWALSERG
jgi:hypothetical protein